MDIKQKKELKKTIRELSQIRGRHTELVSVYVPAGYSLDKIIGHLQDEQGTASNIKDARTRNNVVDSLERAIRALRLYKRTPEKGLAIFSGNASESDNKIDIKVWVIEPPEAINQRIYRCDQTFKTDILQSMLEENEVYGLIAIDRREATVGLLRGTNIKVLTDFSSGVPGKFKAGGQCVMPDTIVQNGEKIEIKDIKIGDKIKSLNKITNKVEYTTCIDFWKVNKDEIVEIGFGNDKIITSMEHTFFVYENGELKEKLAEDLNESDLLVNNNLERIKIDSIKKTKGSFDLIDLETKNNNYFANNILVHNSSQRLERLIDGMAKEFMKRVAQACLQEFLPMKTQLKGLLVGGPGRTKDEFVDELNEELKRKVIGILDITYTDEHGLHDLVEKAHELLANETIIHEKKIMQRFFEGLGKGTGLVTYGKDHVREALNAGAVELVLLSEDLEEYDLEGIEDEAEAMKTKVQLISTDTREGQQLKEMGGFAAILRYAYQSNE